MCSRSKSCLYRRKPESCWWGGGGKSAETWTLERCPASSCGESTEGWSSTLTSRVSPLWRRWSSGKIDPVPFPPLKMELPGVAQYPFRVVAPNDDQALAIPAGNCHCDSCVLCVFFLAGQRGERVGLVVRKTKPKKYLACTMRMHDEDEVHVCILA